MVKHLTISGMNCHHCVYAVRTALTSMSDVTVLEVEIGSATIETSEADGEALFAIIDEEGFTLDEVRTVG